MVFPRNFAKVSIILFSTFHFILSWFLFNSCVFYLFIYLYIYFLVSYWLSYFLISIISTDLKQQHQQQM